MKNRFEINQLIGYVLEEYPDRLDLIQEFQNCDVSKGKWKGNDYFCFVDVPDPSEPDSKWQFVGNFDDIYILEKNTSR